MARFFGYTQHQVCRFAQAELLVLKGFFCAKYGNPWVTKRESVPKVFPEMKRAIVLIAQGTEEMEAVIAIDVLRRASVEVLVVSVNGPQVICARKTKILPDKEFESITESEWKVYKTKIEF